VHDFLETIDGGEDAYLTAAGAMHESLYAASCQRAGKRYFVDKTPRYYLVLPEIRRALPEAKVIVLFRNPLAVLASVIGTWTGTDPSLLARQRDDLLLAPRLLAEAVAADPSVIVIRYEEFVRSPEDVVRRLCTQLGLEFEPSMIEYGKYAPPTGRLGDQDTIRQRIRPDPAHADRWTAALGDRRAWPWFDQYLRLLGEDLVTAIGYDWAELERTVAAHRPDQIVELPSPFELEDGALSPWPKLVRSLRMRGFLKTVRRGLEIIARSSGPQR
jgi:hypothetical protein